MLGKNIGDTYSFGVVMWSEVNKKREFCILGTRFFFKSGGLTEDLGFQDPEEGF